MAGDAYMWLIRHAPVAGPHGVIHDPDAPADVSNTARIESLRARLPKTGAVFCSPARRTLETAAALRLEPLEERAFREQSFGTWTGRTHRDIRAELGDKAYEDFWRAPADNRPPGGESFVDQVRRVEAGLSALPDGDVILVVHSGTVRAALAVALGITPERALRFVIDPLSLTRIDRLGPSWRIVSVNQH
jgi:alpha-ribazole phosphatase